MSALSFLIPVQFDGDGEGTYQLSWGQAGHLDAMLRLKTWHPLGGVKPLPAGTGVDDIVDELRYLMSRYQTMRTRLEFTEGGRTLQTVSGSGEIMLEVVDAGNDQPDNVAEAVRERYATTGLDFTAEYPIRMAVVRRDDRLTHMVVLISHIATDAFGAMILIDEVARRVSTPVDGLQPVAQAQWQQSPAGQRHNDATLRYWEKVLRTIEPRRFPVRDHLPVADGVSGRYRQGELTSPALGPAIAAVSARTGVESTHILIAAHAIALHRVTGVNPVVVRPLVSNRFRPGLGRVVCTLVAAGVYVLDAGDFDVADSDSAAPAFDEMLARAQRATLTAYKHAYFDSEALERMTERIIRERGEEISLSSFINSRRGVTLPQLQAPTSGELAELAGKTTFGWSIAQDSPSFEDLFIHCDDVADAVQLTVQLDTHVLTPAEGENILRTIESEILAAAH